MRSLARWCFIHRRIVLAAWIAGLVGLTAIHSAAGSGYSDNFKLPSTESFDAIKLLQRSAPKASGDTDQIVIAVNQGRVTDPAIRARVDAMLAKVARLPHVTSVTSPYGAAAARQIAPSGRC
jgi:RND superfamily putative drug exporter